MVEVRSKNALPTIGAMYVTISFQVYEIQNKTFLKDGNSQLALNVRENRHILKKGAIYNAIKREFPNRTVTAYNIIVIDYYYGYNLENYRIIRKNDKEYEIYKDQFTNKDRRYVRDKFVDKDNYVGDFNQNNEG